MKFFASVEITIGIDSWIEINQELCLIIEERALKFYHAMSNFEATKVSMLVENSNLEKSIAFLSRDDFLQDCMNAGVEIKKQWILSNIEKFGLTPFQRTQNCLDSKDCKVL